MVRNLFIFGATAMLILFLYGCKQGINATEATTDSLFVFKHEPANAVYHWKTSFLLNEYERNFLREHKVRRMYIRMFDVGKDNLYNGEGEQPVPIATTIFMDSLKTLNDMDIVPVVYITVEALRLGKPICDKILKRVDDMCRAQKVRYNEVQFDCDWTKETKSLFFTLCQDARGKLNGMKKGFSATIRLHQLRDTLPDIDYGVLMLYNTESLINPKVRNSILSSAVITEYMRHATSDKHLDFAYPTYEWTLWFKDGKFNGILPNGLVLPKDGELRHEQSDYGEIMKAKKNIKSGLIDIRYRSSNIIYHLDSANLSKYSKDEIENIYSH
jgi:hypothetical protein